MRTLLGFWIAPLTVGIITGGALTLAIDPIAFLVGLSAAAVAAVVTLAMGVPVGLLLERLGWVDWRVYLGAGALAGLAVALVGCAGLGGVAALIFWAAVRPDRDRPLPLGGVPSP
jgi:hypothetical protein